MGYINKDNVLKEKNINNSLGVCYFVSDMTCLMTDEKFVAAFNEVNRDRLKSILNDRKKLLLDAQNKKKILKYVKVLHNISDKYQKIDYNPTMGNMMRNMTDEEYEKVITCMCDYENTIFAWVRRFINWYYGYGDVLQFTEEERTNMLEIIMARMFYIANDDNVGYDSISNTVVISSIKRNNGYVSLLCFINNILGSVDGLGNITEMNDGTVLNSCVIRSGGKVHLTIDVSSKTVDSELINYKYEPSNVMTDDNQVSESNIISLYTYFLSSLYKSKYKKKHMTDFAPEPSHTDVKSPHLSIRYDKFGLYQFIMLFLILRCLRLETSELHKYNDAYACVSKWFIQNSYFYNCNEQNCFLSIYSFFYNCANDYIHIGSDVTHPQILGDSVQWYDFKYHTNVINIDILDFESGHMLRCIEDVFEKKNNPLQIIEVNLITTKMSGIFNMIQNIIIILVTYCTAKIALCLAYSEYAPKKEDILVHKIEKNLKVLTITHDKVWYIEESALRYVLENDKNISRERIEFYINSANLLKDLIVWHQAMLDHEVVKATEIIDNIVQCVTKLDEYIKYVMDNMMNLFMIDCMGYLARTGKDDMLKICKDVFTISYSNIGYKYDVPLECIDYVFSTYKFVDHIVRTYDANVCCCIVEDHSEDFQNRVFYQDLYCGYEINKVMGIIDDIKKCLHVQNGNGNGYSLKNIYVVLIDHVYVINIVDGKLYVHNYDIYEYDTAVIKNPSLYYEKYLIDVEKHNTDAKIVELYFVYVDDKK